jgi:type II secretory pathway component GspD/PulD (secretin)
MKKIERIIKAFDAPTPQVLIDTKIVEITLRQENQRSLNWERLLKGLHNLDYKGTFPIAASFAVSPELTTASQLISIGTMEAHNFTAAFKLLETLGDARIVSEPKILATNNQEAKIMVGAREAYVLQTLAQAKATTVSGEDITFIDVGVKLNVVPTIHKDGFITMKIKPESSYVRETITTTLGSRVPIVATSEVETVIKVKDGTMVMLAGMIKEEKRKDTSGVPIASGIPILGALFGSKAALNKRVEVVVFLTPHIVSGDVGVLAEDLEGTETKKLFSAIPAQEKVAMPKEAALPGTTSEIKPEVNIQDKLKGLKEY